MDESLFDKFFITYPLAKLLSRWACTSVTAVTWCC